MSPNKQGNPNIFCEVCGTTPAKRVSFYYCYGIIIYFGIASYSGRLCYPCSKALKEKALKDNLLKMWFNPISIIGGIIAIIYNNLCKLPENTGQVSTAERKNSSNNDDRQILSEYAAFLILIATADGSLNKREENLLRKLVRATAKTAGISIYNRDLNSILNRGQEKEAISNLQLLTSVTPGFRHFLTQSAWRIAAADGIVSPEEAETIMAIGTRAGLNQEDLYYCSLAYYRPDDRNTEREKAASTLGITSDASKEKIKKRYRELARKFHPDRHPDKTEDQKRILSQKFAAISDAYKTLIDSESGEKVLWGRLAGNRLLTSVKEGDVVECFLCDQNSKLPKKEQHLHSRCPECQALLLFREEVAEILDSA